MRPKKRSSLVRMLWVTALVAVAWWPLNQLLVRAIGVSEINMAKGLIAKRLGFEGSTASAKPSPFATDAPSPDVIELDPTIRPFREIGERLGPRALGNDFFAVRGGAVFDANGDGRLDLFFPHPGRTIAKALTEDGVLTRERAPALPCSLFLNQGNDDEGMPIFANVEDLQRQGNGLHVREELLFENKYRPRDSHEDDPYGPGRVSWGAVSADFDGNGRQDLYLLNTHYGLPNQTHELGMVVYPPRENLGREARRKPLVLRFPSFLWIDQEDGLGVLVDHGEEPEPEGRNSLYLNLGDRDGDGIPEWEDATDRLGVGGQWASTSAAIGDYDRDGDLDFYVANFLDPDYWGFGSDRFAGNRNQLYKNLLTETGELAFEDVAVELQVAGLHDQEGLEASVYFPAEDRYVPMSEQLIDGEQVGEKADHSWAAELMDWNADGWPDLVVANDLTNRLRVYENLQGAGFRFIERFNEPTWDGCWMGMSVGDLDGDLSEDLFLTNCGSQVMSARNNALMIEDSKEANVQALAVLNYAQNRGTLHNEILSFDSQGNVQRRATEVEIRHSEFVRPDMSRAANLLPQFRDFFDELKFETSLTGLEFAWNAPMFDVDNDGDLDLYFAGSLMRGNDNFLGDWSGSPGRLLINRSQPGKLAFEDRTLEYRVLDIADMDYDYNPPRRPAPGTGWHKRDYIYITDTDAYSGMGLDASEGSSVRDILRMHEAAFGIFAADLNADGYQDLMVTHTGGYNALSASARNLKVDFAGRVLAVPAPNKILKPPTNFEPGPTFLYINQGPPEGQTGQWARLRLLDRGSRNIYGVGAKVVVNGKLLRRVRATTGAAFGATNEDLHLGLGVERLETLEITWPSGKLEPQRLTLDPPLANQLVCVDRAEGIVPCP